MGRKCKLCGAPLGDTVSKCPFCGTVNELPVQSQPVNKENEDQGNTVQVTREELAATLSQVVNSLPVGENGQINLDLNDFISLLNMMSQMTGNGTAINLGEALEDESEASTAATSTPNAAPASASTQKDARLNVFATDDWKSAWKNSFDKKKSMCLVLTDTSNVGDRDVVYKALLKYFDARAEKKVQYVLLDICSQKVAEGKDLTCKWITDLLKKVYHVEVPDYMMMVGDETVIPKINWKNGAGDSDMHVPSDLCYITLDTSSPWDGFSYKFNKIPPVGRVLGRADNNFAESVKYFENTAAYDDNVNISVFEETAHEWIFTTRNIIEGFKADLIECPPYATDSYCSKKSGYKPIGDMCYKYNLLGFNLHGSNSTDCWYGQDGSSHPEGFDATLLPKVKAKGGYMICVEACYGAHTTVLKKDKQGILVTALSNGCLGFVGSTMIAYGGVTGAMSHADYVACGFEQAILKGKNTGTAFMEALDLVMKKRVSEVSLKTISEFALYGDPTVTLKKSNAKDAGEKLVAAQIPESEGQKSVGIKLLSCDSNIVDFAFGKSPQISVMAYSSDSPVKIKQMAYTMKTKGMEYIKKNHSDCSGIEPKVFKVLGGNEYRTIYTKDYGIIKKIVRLHMDENGNILESYESK